MVLKDRPVKASHTLASSGLNFAESPEIAIAKYVLAVLWEWEVSNGIAGWRCSQVFQSTDLPGSCHMLVLLIV